jgi:hypothetical protein
VKGLAIFEIKNGLAPPAFSAFCPLPSAFPHQLINWLTGQPASADLCSNVLSQSFSLFINFQPSNN